MTPTDTAALTVTLGTATAVLAARLALAWKRRQALRTGRRDDQHGTHAARHLPPPRPPGPDPLELLWHLPEIPDYARNTQRTDQP